MSNLGGTNVSEDTDKDANVDSIVAGTNVDNIDNTDPRNPIINVADSGGKNTTKGDLEGFSTVAARIPVGTNDQVLTADSTDALGVKWKTPAAGGSGNSFMEAVAPGTGFGMAGVQAGIHGIMSPSTLVLNTAYMDIIYFDGSTTLTTVSSYVANTSTGGTISVGLHPMTDRGTVGNQTFSETITMNTVGNVIESTTFGTPFTPAEGWFWLVTWCPANITNCLFKQCTSHNANVGTQMTGFLPMSAATENSEFGIYRIFDNNYDVAPDAVLTTVDLNDITELHSTTFTTNGNFSGSLIIPLTVFTVQ